MTDKLANKLTKGRIERVGYSVKDAAAAISVHPNTIRQQIRSGALKSRRLGRKYIIFVDDLKSFFDGLSSVN